MMTAMATDLIIFATGLRLAAVHKQGLRHRDINPTESCIRYPASNPGFIARMNIFPRSDLSGLLDRLHLVLHLDFHAFSRSPFRRSVPGFAEMLSNLGRH